MFQILVVEDDKNACRLMEAVLTRYGYDPITAHNGVEALDVLDRKHVDLIILDVMMPRMDGYEFTNTLRMAGNTIPILMVTARETQADKRRGFQIGTDDYMVKPVDEEEMLLRIRALLRRAQIVSDRKIVIGDVVLDYDSFTVKKNGEVQELPQKEFLLLYKLLSYPERIFTKNQLMDEFWGYESDTYSDTVKVHINRIRNKIASFPEIDVITVRGLGYRGVKNG